MTTLVSAVDVVRAKFDFSVDKFPLVGPDGMRTPHYGLFKSDGTCVGNAVSSKYLPHTTDDVIALTEAASHAFEDEIDVQAHWREGHHVIVAPTKDFRKSVFGTADNIFPRMVISAGYDGRPFRASLGMYRDACRNMARLQQVEGTSVSIRHTHSLRGRMNELIDVFEGLKDGWKKVCDVVAELQNRQVALASFLDKVYPMPDKTEGRGATLHKKRTEEIFRRVQRERYATGRPTIGADFQVSAWECYNAVQGYVQWDSIRHGKMNEFDRILAAMDSPAVAKAESLVMGLLA